MPMVGVAAALVDVEAARALTMNHMDQVLGRGGVMTSSCRGGGGGGGGRQGT